ncbi:transcription factor AP-1-like [Varroa jacobsoni]|uniref:BZIP domain-containing protein n=1 Tax=Varroa destructor TaxID=109461 RepID=A0A7M7JQ63_VARDE|nr:transcription factor AP-1-like [Varroa destructor]XP_022699475.1 transcription factor AP-1-like [Varroa jacobsoni]
MMSDCQEIRSKRPMTLDLESGSNTRAKRLKNQLAAPVISSPDLHRLALASPDVEKFIKGSLQVNSSAQPTPVSAYIFPSKDPTVQQKQFVKGFEDALEQCKRRGSLNPVSCEPPPMSSCATTTLTTLTTANLESLNVQLVTVASSQSSTQSSAETHSSDTSDSMSMSMPMATVKDEQTVPNGVDPIDMRDQEKLKLDRKRLRNRIAASKCRKKKLERISQLEAQVRKLNDENLEYEKMINMLRHEISTLRQEAIMHQQSGCHIKL